jgi:DNA polymerase-3 subunit alpha
MEELKAYLSQNSLHWMNSNVNNRIYISDKEFCLITPQNGVIFDDKFHLIAEGDCDNYIYQFGGEWYWDKREDIKDPKLNELRYLGESTHEIKTDHFLGVRGEFEILNGSRIYKDWVSKAKFLGVKSLGICEKNTLAGVMKFQLECQSSGIKPIIGQTITVYNEPWDLYYDVKCFVKNENGWRNLLLINKEINVLSKFKCVEQKRFFELADDLIIVIDPKSLSYNKLSCLPEYMNGILFDYYQLDTVEYEDDERDREYLENLNRYYNSGLDPIVITDAFYLEPEHYHIKNILNNISGVREFKSTNQYFKSDEQYFDELEKLFNPKDDNFFHIYQQAVTNRNKLVEDCNYTVDIKNRHLPKYEMTEEESLEYNDNEDLFWGLIEKGLKRRVAPHNYYQYVERIEKEYDVIKFGDVVDYFLTLHDIISWCNREGILVGIGRGSAGGSMVSYVLGLIHLDPIEFDLLFERFLNVGRIAVSLPDIDCDFPGKDRNRVKTYIESRFGNDYVCSVGTYTIFKLKSAIKDLSKLHGISFGDVNMVTGLMSESGKDFSALFKMAVEDKRIKSFINRYPEVINNMRLILGIPKAKSVHACAMMIFPKEKTMYEWVPVREEAGNIVSEWEGNEMDSAGFLKEDILGVAQLDKFQDILTLIKQSKGEDIDIYSIPLDDKQVYKYFKQGWNGDVFHFGSRGLTEYCKELLPDNIEDLIAGISLYRPGAMENNFHNEYISRKFGKKKVKYFTGSEEILNKTYGVFVYQEQIMKLCQVLGGLTLVEADDVRKAMVKKKYEALHKYKDRFIEHYVTEFGVEQEYSEEVWGAIDRASTYLFNRSHAAAYSITGYISQWFKVHYPLEFWSVAFNYASDKDFPEYISEINITRDIKLFPVDINNSRDTIYANHKTKSIYWSFGSIKQIGGIASNQLLEEFNKNGQYFTFEEFLSRHRFKGSKVTKQIIENLIFSGAFDEIEQLDQPYKRYHLFVKYREINKVKVDTLKDFLTVDKNLLADNWYWLLQQKKLSGIAFFNYGELCDTFLDSTVRYASGEEINSGEYSTYKSNVKTGGILVEVNERHGEKGDWCRLVVENNYQLINIIIWNEEYSKLKNLGFNELIGEIMLFTGEATKEKYNQKNVIIFNKNSEIIFLSKI